MSILPHLNSSGVNKILNIIFSICLFCSTSCSCPNNDSCACFAFPNKATDNIGTNHNQKLLQSKNTHNVKNDLFRMNLFGKIKSVTDSVYFLNQIFLDSPKKLIAVKIYYFDTYGFSTRETTDTINKDNTFYKSYALGSNQNNSESIDSFFNSQGILSSINVTKYDINDSINELSYYKADGSLYRKYMYTYDLNGNKTDCKIYNIASKLFQIVKYISDFNGRNINTCFYDINLGLLKEYRYVYDWQGNQTEFSFFDGNENFDYKYTYKYDDNENEIEKDSINSFGDLCVKWLSRYDDKCNLIKTSKTSAEIEIESETFLYIYSNTILGNWTNKTAFKLKFGQPVPQTITQRHIIFY